MYIRKHDDDNNGESCNVGDSSVLHCVSCTAHNNTQQNIMAALISLPKARTREKWAFRKVWLGKRGGNLWQRRKRQLSESFEIIESAKTAFHS